MNEHFTTMADAAIADRTFPGIVAGAWKSGCERFFLARGFTNACTDGIASKTDCSQDHQGIHTNAGSSTSSPENGELQPVTRSTVYDLASLTKVLSTSILALQAVDQGRLDPDAPVGRYLPELNQESGTRRISSLLTHTAGLPPVPALYDRFPDFSTATRPLALKTLFDLKPERPEGEAVVYSCTGFLLLGLALERIYGLGLGELFARAIAAPLGLRTTGFASMPRDGRDEAGEPVVSWINEIPGAAPTEVCPWRGKRMSGQVHDESSWCLGGQAGNAGLFGCLDEVAAIASIFLGDGVSRGVRILSSDSVRLMNRPMTSAPGERRAFGMRLHDNETLDGPAWPSTGFGHTGFTGTAVFMDPEREFLVVSLANRVYYGRESTAPRMSAFRKAFHSGLHEAFSL